mmetsp:Transcript_4864/g.14049  ORF Transcript_4864/g.14049 Transcript_4864/m.14049 type:complete len:132 (+) Transcript_4864:26-421(+)
MAVLALAAAAATALLAPLRPLPSRGRTVLRPPPSMGLDEAEIGDTWFTSFDSKGEDGLAPDGTFPPGEDLVEREMRRLFNVDGDDEEFAADEIDELKLMMRLWKELGEEDYARIFDQHKVRGHDVWGDRRV